MSVTLEPVLYGRSELESMFLPVGQMLQIDRALQLDKGRIVTEIDVPGHWVFPMHFPTDPIFPGTLLIEAAGQSVAVWAWHFGFRGRPRLVKVEAKFESPVLPRDQRVRVETRMRQRKSVFLGESLLVVEDRLVASIDSMLIVMPSLVPDASNATRCGLRRET